MNDDPSNILLAQATGAIGDKTGAAPPPALSESLEEKIAKKKAEVAADHKEESRLPATGTTTTGAAVTGKAQWTPELASKMAGGIFVFAILLFAMISILVWKNKSVDTLLRTFGILLIIVASVFLVIVGYSDQQIAPVMGLMGTIAGYLLSRRPESAPSGEAAVTPKPTAPPKPDDSGMEPPTA